MVSIIFQVTKAFIILVNPVVPNAPFLYPLKTSENLTVFWRFQRVEKGWIGKEWVNHKERREWKLGRHWDKVFKNGPIKIYRRQYFKRLKWYGCFKGALSGLRQFLVNENPVRIMKNACYFTFSLSRYLFFVLTFCSCREAAWLER